MGVQTQTFGNPSSAFNWNPVAIGVDVLGQGVGAYTNWLGIKEQRRQNKATNRLNSKMFKESQTEATRQFDTQLAQDKEFGEWDRKVAMRNTLAQMMMAKPQILAQMHAAARNMGIGR
jgi:hypothetical protein